MIIDEDSLIEEIEEEVSRPYRDPFGGFYGKPFGDPNKITDTQEKMWRNLHENDIKRFGLIGGKGSGKSFGCAAWCLHWAQTHPDSVGCLVANDKRQARDSGGEKIVEVGRQCGFDVQYFRSKKIQGQQHSIFYAIDVDGKGIGAGETHKILVRSLQAVESMEGSEFDYMYIEEIQDATKDPIQIALSRNRGNGITPPDEKNPLITAGMTSSEMHWMYDLMEEGLGLTPERKFDADEDDGVLYEPTIFENRKNLGEATINQYKEMMDPQTAERHIYAERTSSKSNRVLHQYRDSIHRQGRMSELCAYKDPYRDIYMLVDFNVSPLCATLWQEKPFNHAWRNEHLVIEYNQDGTIAAVKEYPDSIADESIEGVDPIERYDSLDEYATPDTTIFAQVDEYEIWPDDERGGGTEGLMRHFASDYDEHAADIFISGDKSGHARDTRGNTTDWGIIQDYATNMNASVIVVPGLESKMSNGKTKYYNPDREPTIKLLNRVLMDANGTPHICFLPTSEFESGGAAASCASVERRPDGSVNDNVDKQKGREVRRTHFFDTVRYATWFWKDGGSPSEEMFDQLLDEAEENMRSLAADSTDWSPTDKSPSGSNWF
jgi:hypothetical protein